MGARWSLAACLLALLCVSKPAQCSPAGADDIFGLHAKPQLQLESRRLIARQAASNGSAASAPLYWTATKQRKPWRQTQLEFCEENDWKNNMVLWTLPSRLRAAMPRVARAWYRCYVMCMGVYFGLGSAWAYYIYFAFGQQLFPSGNKPAWTDILEQMKVATLAIPLYSVLPAVGEYMIEEGWTKAYSRISDMGVGAYLAYFALYMAFVEFGIYWMHRLLHDIRPGYRYLHHIHHKYNKEHTLSPFAGLAFHPLDGCLQAAPYVAALFIVPAHALTFELLLFATGVWTTNIHDCIDGKVEPIMGAGYHAIHHTTYRHNYGQFFVYMDQLFGTLTTPRQYAELLKAATDAVPTAAAAAAAGKQS